MTNLTIKLLCATIVLSAGAFEAFAKGWRGVTPLRSTRQDTARFSKECAAQNRCQFNLDDSEVMIVFYDRSLAFTECPKVPEGTVLAIIVKFNQARKLEDFTIKNRKFRVFDPSSPPNKGYKAYYYFEDEFIINTYQGRVLEVVYIAAKKDTRLCPSYYEDPKGFIEVGLQP
jgi:hypothetical protein